jgi:hypothetical protein
LPLALACGRRSELNKALAECKKNILPCGFSLSFGLSRKEELKKGRIKKQKFG